MQGLYVRPVRDILNPTRGSNTVVIAKPTTMESDISLFQS